MNIGDIPSVLSCELLQDTYEERPLSGAYSGDLLSDVMGRALADEVLITVQAHKNTVAVASLANLAAILICNGRPVADDMITAARNEGIAIFRTELDEFECSGRLWAALRSGGA